MSNIITTLGTTLGIAVGEPATFDAAGYEAVGMTYTAVGEVGDLGEFGGTREVVEFTPIDTGVVAKRPGSINYGEMSLQIGRDATDAGQIALQAALDGANEGDIHSFRVTDRNGDKLYFTGIVSSFTYNAGSANTIFGGSCTVNLTSKPVPVAAA